MKKLIFLGILAVSIAACGSGDEKKQADHTVPGAEKKETADANPSYEKYFPGVPSVTGHQIAQAYKKSIAGIQTGRVYRIL